MWPSEQKADWKETRAKAGPSPCEECVSPNRTENMQKMPAVPRPSVPGWLFLCKLALSSWVQAVGEKCALSGSTGN